MNTQWKIRHSDSFGAMVEDTRIGDTVATVYGADHANAHLISAAPELLSVCKSLLLYVETYGGEVTANIEAALPIYRAAIAKAEGK